MVIGVGDNTVWCIRLVGRACSYVKRIEARTAEKVNWIDSSQQYGEGGCLLTNTFTEAEKAWLSGPTEIWHRLTHFHCLTH